MKAKFVINNKKKMIVPSDERLTTFELGLLSTLVNNPETDYKKAEELCPYFRSDTLDDIQSALDKLAEYDYLNIIPNGVYAVNKLKIHQMKIL